MGTALTEFLWAPLLAVLGVIVGWWLRHWSDASIRRDSPTNATPSASVVNDVAKSFGGNMVLANVSFDIKKGEVVGLIGPNGAGKTTLFNVITGFYRTRTGSVRFNGKDITRLKPEAICMLGLCRTFQITKPFSNIPVLKNVMIGALSREKSITGARKRAEEVLEFVGMLDKKDLLGRNRHDEIPVAGWVENPKLTIRS